MYQILKSEKVIQIKQRNNDDQDQQKSLLSVDITPNNRRTPRKSTIILKFPQYQRYSKVSPTINRPPSFVDSLALNQESQIQVSPLIAWLLLLLNIVATALVPCWLITYLDKEIHTRNSWRFFVLSILTLPFVAYQRRRIAQIGGNIFSLINKDLLKKNFIGSINYCIQILFIIQAIKLTSLTHAVTLVSLKYYIIAVIKVYKNHNHHQFQKAGIMLVTIAIICQMSDNFSDNQNILAGPQYTGFYGLSGDIIALAGSIVSAYLFQKYQIPKQPRFLNLFFRNIFTSFNFICFGYYFGGSQLSFNEYYGVLALFSAKNFVNIFYIAIMLGLSLMVSNIMLNQIFSTFILDIANAFVPFLSSFFYQLLSIQSAFGYTNISFGFLIPGLILILSGENALNDGQIKIDFVVYRPEREKQQKQLKQQPYMEQFQLLEWKKYKKISEDLIAPRSSQSFRNMSM